MGFLSDFAGTLTGPATNTAAGAISAENLAAEQALGALTWMGTTAPSGTINKVYAWNRVGHSISIYWFIKTSVAGALVTAVETPLPADLPTPWAPSIQVNDSWSYIGAGAVLASANAALSNGASCGLYKNSSGIFVLRVYSGVNSLSANFAMGSVTYLTAA